MIRDILKLLVLWDFILKMHGRMRKFQALSGNYFPKLLRVEGLEMGVKRNNAH